MTIYKIRHIESGLYSTGGVSPKWTKAGKTWNNIGHLKSHLRTYITANIAGRVSSREVIREMFYGWAIIPIKMVSEEPLDPVTILPDIEDAI